MQIVSSKKDRKYCNIACFNKRKRIFIEEVCEICKDKYIFKNRYSNKKPWCNSCVQYNRQIKHRYGISIIEYMKILQSQNNCCAICKVEQSGYKNKRLSVDHCHQTGRVRGLLCDYCNNAIGKFKDNPILSKNATEYLIMHQEIQKPNDKWHKHFLEMAALAASKSKDPSMKVGAIIVDEFNIVQSMGYNGFPRKITYTDTSRLDRPKKYSFMVHAEINAIIHAGRDKAKNCRMYISCNPMDKGGIYPCVECTKAIIQAGISEIVQYNINSVEEDNSRPWTESIMFSKEMLNEAGIKLTYVNP